MHHNIKVVNTIPIALEVKGANKTKLILPRTPNSAKANEGMTAMDKKNTKAINNPSRNEIGISFHQSNNTNCEEKTKTRKNVKPKTVLCSLNENF